MLTDSEKALLSRESKETAADFLHSAIVPSSVYRLQFNRKLTFRQAAEIVPYLRALGVDAVYASPIFQALPGSVHGYDVADPTRLNSEIGTQEDFERYCAALKANGLGQILDIVPNHMGIAGGKNRWWIDVLENGPGSIYAHFFDIDWEPEKKELRNKVLIPVLGDLYGRTLENGDIKLAYENGALWFHYWETAVPVSPKTYPAVLGRGLEELRGTLGAPHPDFLEYESILTAFRNLPEPWAGETEKIAERNREKEIAKKRLASLVSSSDAVREFVARCVERMNGRKEDPSSFDAIDALLNEQHYRLAFWRVASEEINYRRFFNINELAALRIEDPAVFAAHHKLAFDLIAAGHVQGLRIDHPDGLYDPPEYFKNIQQACRARGLPAAYVVVEKILDRKETLAENWLVHGTVGYDYLNALNRLFIQTENEKHFDRIYKEFTGLDIDISELIYSTKKFFALVNMAGEINMLGSRLDRISEKSRRYRDLTRNNLTLAIRETIACFPVYRTYIGPHDEKASERDEKYIRIAIEKAKRKTPALNPAVYDFLMNVLLMKFRDELHFRVEEEPLYRDFIMRFQQLTGPIMAKGMEDTAFYVHNRFISLNEVGGDPSHFGSSRADFHRQNAERNKRWPMSMITLTTHDTKRSSDVRMRLDVLSEIPDDWSAAVAKWTRMNERHKTEIGGRQEPDRNVEYFFYQSLAGVWPLHKPADKAAEAAFVERIWNYMLKAVREAQVRTSWMTPDAEYEAAVKKFVESALASGDDNLFLKNFETFTARLSAAGMLNSLSACAIEIGSPGVVDVYQGTGLWDFSLVDPDNRRPRNFEARRAALEAIARDAAAMPACDHVRALMSRKEDGHIKMYMMWKGLHLRRDHKELFLGADYTALETEGEKKDHVVAFLRRAGNKTAIVAAGRFLAGLAGHDGAIGDSRAFWADTAIVLPKDLRPSPWNELYTGRAFQPSEKNTLSVQDLLSELPAAILTSF